MYLIRILSNKFKIFEISKGKMENSHFSRLPPQLRVVGIATAYGLDGLGIESRWGEIFRTCPDQP
jgi:hypothetical protein